MRSDDRNNETRLDWLWVPVPWRPGVLRDAGSESGRLEEFRAFLRLRARLDLDPRLEGKFDLSGVVQQTLLEAHQGITQFRGDGEDALLAWLQQILSRNVLDEVRRLRRVKYDVALECSLDDLTSRSRSALALDQTSPSGCAVRNEELLKLAAALEKLPADQQTAIVLHHLQGVPLAEVASQLNRTKAAIAGLLHRGMLRLRELLSARNNGAASEAPLPSRNHPG
jgi:RNA polymerase sigma-70 factor (ECF subfamily)